MSLFPAHRRHLLLQTWLWSPLGLPIVRASTWLAQRWTSVVMNRSALSTSNGEYWLVSCLGQSPVVFDVGFHRGDFTDAILAARPEAQIFGFEPAESIRQKYLVAHPVMDPRIKLEPLALSDSEGECLFHDDASAQNSLAPIEYTGRTRSYPVKVTTVDLYAKRNGIGAIDLLKVDAEGYDLQVLEGASSLLANEAVAFLLFEYNFAWVLTRRYLRDAVNYFDRLPYSLFRLFNGFLSPLEYSHKEERFDHTTMFVAVSHRRLAAGDIVIRHFPAP